MTVTKLLSALLAATLLTGVAQAAGDRPAALAPLGPPPIPSDNPSTPEKVELGKMLFLDPILSGTFPRFATFSST